MLSCALVEPWHWIRGEGWCPLIQRDLVHNLCYHGYNPDNGQEIPTCFWISRAWGNKMWVNTNLYSWVKCKLFRGQVRIIFISCLPVDRLCCSLVPADLWGHNQPIIILNIIFTIFAHNNPCFSVWHFLLVLLFCTDLSFQSTIFTPGINST